MTRRRPLFGWIAFGLLLLTLAAGVGIVLYAQAETADAFLPVPPWWALATELGTLVVGGMASLALLLGVIGAARREKPGWPAITAMILALPLIGAAVVSGYLWAQVVLDCAGPSGACG